MTHVQWQTSGKLSGKPVANSVANPVANLRALGERFWHAPRKIIVVLIIRYSIKNVREKRSPTALRFATGFATEFATGLPLSLPLVCHWTFLE